MKYKLFLIFFLSLSFIFLSSQPSFAATSITSCEELQNISIGSTGDYVLSGNIDCSSITNFTPIEGFAGTLDGQNHTIDNLTINRPADSGIALFKSFDVGITIADINFTNVNIAGSNGVGCIIGSSITSAMSLLNKVNCSGSVTGSSGDIGGLIGFINYARVTNSSFSGTVDGTGASSVGGLIGGLANEGPADVIMSNSYFNGSIFGHNNVGGLIGYEYCFGDSTTCSISKSYTTGTITSSDENIGGLIGSAARLSITDSFTTHKSNAEEYLPLVGNSSGTITNSFDAITLGANYFKNNNTVSPLSVWDFTNIWATTINYPVFTWQEEETPTPTPTPTPSSFPSQNNSSAPTFTQDFTCHDSKPIGVSDLFQINTTKNSAKIFFTPLSDTNHYFISFSTKPIAEDYSADVTLAREGVQNFTINLLKPNTIYYAKVRGQNGCMPGDWSNIMKFKTNSQIFYKNFSPINQLSSNLITKTKITKNSDSVELTPIITQSPKTQTQSDPPLAEKKKCILLWCW